MDLRLDPSIADGYTSNSQIARLVTEAWASNNFYCLACPSERVIADKPNSAVRDFSCPQCFTTYQLKSKNGKHGGTVRNSAYAPKIAAINEGRVPHYAFLDYSRDAWTVTGLSVVPGHFITRGLIQRTPPLKPSATRAGWVGSNILLSRVPPEGRISLISDSTCHDPTVVRTEWSKVEFLATDSRASGGWGAEILACIRTLLRETGRSEFGLPEFYTRFVPELSNRYPDNRNIEAKIRQQLQLLRDGGILRFLGRGRYRALA